MAKNRNPASAPATSALGDIGDELAKLRARATLLETMLVEIDGAMFDCAHDAINQQANDVANGLDALIRRIDDGEAQLHAEAQAETAFVAFKEWREFESAICDLRDAAEAAEVILEETVLRDGGCFADMIRKQFKNKTFDNYHLYAFTSGEYRAIDYILRHLVGLCRELDKTVQSTDGFGAPGSAGTAAAEARKSDEVRS